MLEEPWPKKGSKVLAANAKVKDLGPSAYQMGLPPQAVLPGKGYWTRKP